MLSLGHFEAAGNIDAGHPQIHAALTAARVFRQDSKAFVNLSLYEQRLQRTLKESLRQLQELQAQRRAARQAELDAAVAQRNLLKMKGQPYDPTQHAAIDKSVARFVFSPTEIEAEARRQDRCADARHAQKFLYNIADYREVPFQHVA
jgi:hypothetical protein